MEVHLRNLRDSVPVIVFLVFTTFFYGPLSIYLPNAQEFWFPLGEIIRIITIVSLIVILALALILFSVPDVISKFLQKLLMGISLGLYIQGNYINYSYGTGVLDGTEIHWEYYTKYGIMNTAIWLFCIALPFVIAYVASKKKWPFTKIMVTTALFLTIIQVPALFAQATSYVPNENYNLQVTSEGAFTLSEEDNIIILVLDAMDERYYEDFIEANPEYIEQLDGFVHYNNVLASGSRTIIGVPSMFTGVPFKREETYADYKTRVWGDDNALSVLHAAGYDVGVYADPGPYCLANVDYVSNFNDGGVHIDSDLEFAEKVYKMGFSRFFPHYLKKYVWFNTAEFTEVADDSEIFSTNNSYFLNLFNENGGYTFDPSLDKAVRLYHIKGAHSPYNTGVDGTVDRNATREDSVTGCFYIVSQLLNDIRSKNPEAYDNSTIIITGDHGDKNIGEYPMLMIKLSGCHDAYCDNSSPVSLFDLPIFLANLVNADLDNQEYGLDLLSLHEGDARERHLFINTANSSRLSIREYATTSHASDSSSLIAVGSYENWDGLDEKYEIGTELSFSDGETGNAYSIEGFGQNTGFRTLLRGPRSELDIPLSGIPDVGLRVNIQLHNLSERNLNFIVYANDCEVMHGISDDSLVKTGLIFDVPTSCFDDTDILKLEFVFPDVPSDEMELSVMKRTITISFVTMVIDKVE